jgi:parallel beta-helix repeat protein
MKRVLTWFLWMGGALMLSSGMCVARGPIAILSDADFTAENGVVSGTGSAEDPYLIAGVEITAAPADAYGVRIENTQAAFVLRGVMVQGATDPSGAAVRVAFSSRGRLEGCTISGSVNGFEIVASTGIVMRDCVVYVTGLGLRVSGDAAEQYNHDINESNLLNDKEIRYYYGLDGQTISGLTTTHLTIAGSRNVTVTGNSVVNGDGLRLAFVTGSTVSANAVYRTSPTSTEHGIFLLQSSDNVVTDNSLRNNRLAGVQLTLSSRNLLRGNQFLANDSGLRLVASDENQVLSNVFLANVSGILLSGGSSGNSVAENVIYHENTKQGITLELADGNRIERNGLTDCEVGITLGEEATGNVVEANTIVNGSYGISLYGSYNWIDKNLIAQQERGIICPETFTRSVTRGNEIRANVFADNSHHVYMNLDSEANRLGENAFLGDAAALVADQGQANVWTINGVGNFWGNAPIVDSNGDGIGESVITVYPSLASDGAPLATWNPVGAGLGILGGLESQTVTIASASGGSVQLSVFVADSGIERWAGFRGFPASFAERFPGVLFRFETETEGRFTMLTVLFDLDIAFFAADGSFVGGAAMKANSKELYTASSPYQYALELPAGSLAALGLADGARLLVP